MSVRSFGSFDVDLTTGELRRHRTRVKLQPILAKLLVELIARPGELISRDDLARRLWPDGIFVDYENNLNNAVARLRSLIGFRWIETLPKRGYRFRKMKVRGARRPDPAAERERQRARHFWNRTTAASLARSIDAHRRAVEIDPDHVLAHAGLADAFILSGDEILGGMNPREALSEAEAAARKALAMDGDCSEALAALGVVAWRLRWDWKSAERLLRASIAIRQDYPTAHLYYCWLLQARGRRREAEAEAMRAFELDPSSPFVCTNVGWMLYTGRRYSDAIVHMRDTLALDEYYAMARLPLGLSLQQAGRADEAVGQLAYGAMLAGSDARYYRAALGHAVAARDGSAKTSIVLGESAAFDRAMVHLGAGNRDAAMDCLEQALAEGSSHLSYLYADPMFDCLRGQRRFQRITRSIGL